MTLNTRTDVLNYLIRVNRFSSYLEVGVGDGGNFRQIICNTKVGIDNAADLNADYKMTSDEFFAQNRERFDLIFIDAYHEEAQLIRDVENALMHLNPGGIIVCHDVNPHTEDYQGDPRVWNGTCWKGWVKLRATREDLDMKAVDVDHGCGIIRRGSQKKVELTEALTWQNLVAHRKEWLGLISADEFLRLREPISVAVSYCSLDAAFLEPLLREASKFSDDITVVATDHLFNGEPEDLKVFYEITSKFPSVTTFVQKWSNSRPVRHWHNASRWEGVVRTRHPWVLQLDGDEVPDGARMKEYLEQCDFAKDGYAFECYWYFRSPRFRSQTTAICGLLMPKKHLTRSFIFTESERGEFRNRADLSVEEHIVWQGKPVMHHFSWVRSKDVLLKKVSSWAHKADRDWKSIIEEEFSHPFSGTEHVHGFQYDTVENTFNISEP
jgi:hypothetical protein